MNSRDFIKELWYSVLSVFKGIIMTLKNLFGTSVKSYYTMMGMPESDLWGGEQGRKSWIHRRKRVTQLYPDERWNLAPRFRGLPAPTVNPDTGEMYCIACLACVRICPSQIIDIQWHRPGPEEAAVDSSGKRKIKIIDRFEIDMGRCLFCALCVEVCPTDPKSIVMSRRFEIGSPSRDGMIFGDRRTPGTHVLPMVAVRDSADQPATAYVNAPTPTPKKAE